MFSIDPDFQASSQALCSLDLCEVRLQLDARFPWLILIPRIAGAVELAHLAPAERAQLSEEMVLAGTAVRAIGEALGSPVEKLNLAMLGNVTRQLHAHVVGRRSTDAAWPGTIWGSPAVAYPPAELETVTAVALRHLKVAAAPE